jgi:exopolyphosphatase/guanosine-5'-triphosphate,3'-diphosphate pyrophosphatase
VERPSSDPRRSVPDVLAAIDIGTNSVHMVVARMAPDGRFEVITRHKEMVRLGESGDDQLKHLTPGAIDRGVAALARCRSVVDTYGAPVEAVATSAVREAENRNDFIRRAQDEAGIDVEVIAGHEEARLIHLGVLQALPLYDTPLILCDIGGGSTELLIGHRGEVQVSRSFKLGAIRMTQRFFDGGVTSKRSVERARRFVRATLAPFVREAAAHPFEVAVGSSGTIESLLGIARAAEGSVKQSVNGAVLTRAALGEVIERLIAAETPEARAEIKGVDKGRADIIVGGAVILEQVMDSLNIESLVISEYALREGVLFDLNNRLHGASLDHLSDLRRRSIEHLMEVCDEDPDHSLQVAELALELFDGLEGRHGLGHDERELLEAAALLANVGLFIAHSRHHQHSYYVIRNSELLSGFTDPEIEIIAQVARYHRRGEPSLKHAPFAALDEHDQRRVRWLAAILRVAIGLDRSHAGAVATLGVDDAVVGADDAASVMITVVPNGDADISLEIYSARERVGLLEQMLEQAVEVR